MRRRRRYLLSSWILLGEAGLCLCIAAFAKKALPFRTFSKILGRQVQDGMSSPLPPDLRTDLVWAFSLFQRLPRVRPL